MSRLLEALSRASLSALLLVLVLLASPQGLQLSSHPTANAQFVPSLPSTILVGYSPATLSPLNEGIPVFSQGDQMWIEVLNTSYSFSLISSDGTSRIGFETVPANSVVLLYSFAGSDKEGSWSLRISSLSRPTLSLSLQVVNQLGHSSGVSLSSYSMQSGQLALGFSVAPSESYNMQGCLLTQAVRSPVEENLPSSLGSATASIALSGSTANISVIGTVSQPFSLWFNLDYTYSYSNLNGSQLVSRPVEVASSLPVVFSSPANQSTTVRHEAVLRVGRYTLETFLDSAQGLSVQETQLLIFNSTWFWLSSCNPFALVAGGAIQRSVSIAGSVSQWPSGFLSAYEYRGVEMVDFLPLRVEIARINVSGTLNGTDSYPVSSEMGFSVLPNKWIEASSLYNGAIYVAASSFPLQVRIVPSFGNEQYSAINTTVSSPFSDYSIKVPVGKLSVRVYLDGVPTKNAYLQLSNGENGVATLSTDEFGNGTFFVPSGNYSLGASLGNSTEMENISISSGNSTFRMFSFKSVPVPADYTAELEISIMVGAVIAIYAWVVMPRQRRYSIRM